MQYLAWRVKAGLVASYTFDSGRSYWTCLIRVMDRAGCRDQLKLPLVSQIYGVPTVRPHAPLSTVALTYIHQLVPPLSWSPRTIQSARINGPIHSALHSPPLPQLVPLPFF